MVSGPKGLAAAQVERNRTLYGANVIPRKSPKAFLEHLWEVFEDDTIRVLVFSAAVSLVFGIFFSPPESKRTDIIQALAIVLAVVVVSGVNSYQNWSKDTEFQSLTALTQERLVSVRRDNIDRNVSMHDLVVGDVVRLKSGDSLPCDGIYICGPGLLMDESSINGESLAKEKLACLLQPPPTQPRHECLLVGNTIIRSGEGFMLVTAVGTQTVMGKLVNMIENAVMEETPLQERLDEMAGQIGKIGLAAGVLTSCTLLLLRIVAAYSANPPTTSIIMDIIQFFIMGVAIVVVAVPEGLPLAVTIALAFSMRKMMADQCMVKTMKACETMGSATYICSDKTGTLTENRMTVRKVVFDDKPYAVPDLPPGYLDLYTRLNQAITLNSTADPDAVDAKGKCVGVGDPTETALIHYIRRASARHPLPDLALMRSDPDFTRLFKKPHSKEDKYQASVFWKRTGGGVGEIVAYITGAPEVVAAWCEDWAPKEEKAPKGKKDFSSRVMRNLDVEASQQEGMRILALGYRVIAEEVECPKHTAAGFALPAGLASWEEAPRGSMCLLGMFCIEDPLRATVKESIETCQKSGIKVMMMTGDSIHTAKAIARQCTITEAPVDPPARLDAALSFYSNGVRKELQKDAHGKYLASHLRCMMGEDFRLLCADTSFGGEELSMEKEKEEKEGEEGEKGEKGEPALSPPPSATGGGAAEAFASPRARPEPFKQYISKMAIAVAPHVRVLARCKPGDKHLMVTALQASGEVVAVTGDGTNDAPALKKADVGLAMGIAGTDVAKDAADIIILDDDFKSIVAAVRWGRSIKENIRKFLAFQLTINIVALTLTFFSACTSGGRNELPLKPVQLLWVNLIMDSFAALALATEPPSEHLMQEKPSKRDAPLITLPMWVNMIGHAVYQIIILLSLTQLPYTATFFGLKEKDLGNMHHDTIIFTVFVALQVRSSTPHAAQ